MNEEINEQTNEWIYKTWLQGREEYWLRVFSEILWKHDWQIEMRTDKQMDRQTNWHADQRTGQWTGFHLDTQGLHDLGR